MQNIISSEPADNAEAVVRAVKQLTTRELFQLSANKVTVSTVAPQPSSFSLFSSAPCVLAWSVHATRDALRRQLVPTTQYPMVELRQGFIFALLQRPPNMRTVMLEVTLIDQVNSSIREADELAEFARGIVDTVPGCKLIVNLIPYNDIGYEHLGFSKPENSKVRAFQQQLWSHGVYAHIRTTRGDDESAACGQLVTLKQRTLEPSVM
jgi:23S rRNA (adenine2503-C2)-methyltransferase